MSKPDYFMRARVDMSRVHNTCSVTHCDGCGDYLGVGRMVFKALFRRRGAEYSVVCRCCGRSNIRVKGDLKRELDSGDFWE